MCKNIFCQGREPYLGVVPGVQSLNNARMHGNVEVKSRSPHKNLKNTIKQKFEQAKDEI